MTSMHPSENQPPPKADASTSTDRTLDDALRRLIATPERLSAIRLWRALNPSERSAATRSLVEAEPSRRTQICAIVAREKHFRPASVEAWPLAKVTAAMAATALQDPKLAMDLLVHLHLPDRSELLASFLDRLGIPHHQGHAEVAVMDRAAITPTVLREAAQAAGESHGQRAAVIYFLALCLQRVPFAADLWSWMAQCEAGTGSVDVTGREPVESEIEDADAVQPGAAYNPAFTTIDKLLIHAAVDAVQQIEGALTEDELDDLVDEVIHLNGRRHRSYFHAGFRDVLFDRPLSEEFPAENIERARWYWAGAIQGWARSENWRSIVHAFDERHTVRALGDGLDEASTAAALHVVAALRAEDRSAEIPGFVTIAALVASPGLFALLLAIGAELLHLDTPAEARAFLELLMDGVSFMEGEGFSPSNPLFLEARRREAHCLRQLGEHRRAKDLLEGLLTLDPDRNVQAMVHADLGLIAGSFRRLSDVYLPVNPGDRDLKLEALQKGQEHFARAVALDVPYSAHGHYCLGVLALGEEEYDAAEGHLEQARARFRSDPQRYGGGALLARTDLYFGIAATQRLEADRLSHAARLLRDALEEGLLIPPYLIAPTIEALGLGDISDVCTVAEAMLKNGGEEALDALARSSAIDHCAPVASAILGRAHREDRRSSDRASDLRIALAGHLRRLDTGTASEILDQLEAWAVDGVGTREFAQLLADPDCFEPAWTREDAAIARARCLESQGNYADATTQLQELFHRLASQETEES
ncbi:MAG TPA: hypothetical protein VLH09_03345, partial [Bryobacteraceae bacterium]|nr:hypothetical protein [Bryobacteraceae bacterium]